MFYAFVIPTLIGTSVNGYDPINGFLWAIKFISLMVVSFIEKMTLYTYSFVGVHGGRSVC